MGIKNRFSILILVLLTSISIGRAASQGKAAPARELQASQALPPEVPITEHDKPGPSDPRKAKIRGARSSHFNLKAAGKASRFAIDERSQSGYGSLPLHGTVEDPLPASESSIVLIGEVLDGEAFLSGDRTMLYSEFEVSVRDILKSSLTRPIATGSTVTVTRPGGAVRLGSGKVVFRVNRDRPLPRKGRTYAFFLRWEEDSEWFSILTAYEIRQGRVVLLDGAGVNGFVPPLLARHQEFAGMSEAEFMIRVRNSVERATSPTQGAR